jgi:hypothetical protein
MHILKSRNKDCYSIPITRLDFASEDKENFESFTNSKKRLSFGNLFPFFLRISR